MGQEAPILNRQVVERVRKSGHLPGLQEQADNLIRWLGRDTVPGEDGLVSYEKHGAIVGALSYAGFIFLVNSLLPEELLEGSVIGGHGANVHLTLKGWRRCEELRQGYPSGRVAFMAMPYGKPEIDRLVNDCFRPAVAETGFNLKRLDDDQRAGLIDDRLRVELKGARFIIADLTHGNQGAYWEAGYAEGLGKPVIYTCEQSVFRKKSHFDTNHHLHVLWHKSAMGGAADRLKATIRATIPEATRSEE